MSIASIRRLLHLAEQLCAIRTMIISGQNNQSVELKVAGYQFPDEKSDEWDANWLRIYLNVKADIGHWQTIDPSLTTWEFQSLVDWFRNLIEDVQIDSLRISFTEPNLAFKLLSSTESTRKVRIEFDLESRPQSVSREDECFVDLVLEHQEVLKVSEDLAAELQKFPER